MTADEDFLCICYGNNVSLPLDSCKDSSNNAATMQARKLCKRVLSLTTFIWKNQSFYCGKTA